MSGALRREIAERAKNRCEYCLYPQQATILSHQLDHIIPKQHGGSDELRNLAFCCALCNRTKGPNLASLDPATGRLTPLFNPREENWHDHFRLAAAHIIGLTPVGRTTVFLLQLNSEARLIDRRYLVQSGFYETP